jgi:hypothetical protein
MENAPPDSAESGRGMFGRAGPGDLARVAVWPELQRVNQHTKLHANPRLMHRSKRLPRVSLFDQGVSSSDVDEAVAAD